MEQDENILKLAIVTVLKERFPNMWEPIFESIANDIIELLTKQK